MTSACRGYSQWYSMACSSSGAPNADAASSFATWLSPNGHADPKVKSQPRPIRSAYCLAYATSSDHSGLSHWGGTERFACSSSFNQSGYSHATSTPPKPFCFSQSRSAAMSCFFIRVANHHQRVYGLPDL